MDRLSKYSGRTPSRKRKSPASPLHNDRYIPNRSVMNLESRPSLTKLNTLDCDSNQNHLSPNSMAHNSYMCAELGLKRERVLAFHNKPPSSKVDPSSRFNVDNMYNDNASKKIKTKQHRYISSAPMRILDAPDVVDDYYLNVLDWGKNNKVAIALLNTVYLWDAETGDTMALMSTGSDENDTENIITSVKFSDVDPDTISIGCNDSKTLLYNIPRQKLLRRLDGHSDRVNCAEWHETNLYTGSRDASIVHHDIRIKEHNVAQFNHHELEVCSLKVSPNGRYLASGSNDNTAAIVDLYNVDKAPVSLIGHTAAVKGLDWCPYYENILATGGGSADRTVKIWNASSGETLSTTHVGGQVSSVKFNPFEPELLVSSKNSVMMYKYPKLTKFKELSGHTERILGNAISPDGTAVCSVGADETLRFWKVFESKKEKLAKHERKPSTPQLSKMTKGMR